MTQLRPALALVLASASPRRRKLLEEAGLVVEVRPAEVDERALPGELPNDQVCRLAEKKASVIAAAQSVPALVLAADTVVVLDGVVLGKPADEDEAHRMLASLSGRSHHVITAYAIHRCPGHEPSVIRAVTTRVDFRPLPPATIERYVSTGEPLDKAGAYGIQGIGRMLVQGIEGSWTNVVGLPLVEVLDDLATLGGPRL